MIWGLDPPRTHEKIIGRKLTLFTRLFVLPFSGYRPGKREKMNNIIKEETLGQRIKAARIRKKMTQEQLAEVMCVPKSTISAYENDKVDIKGSVLKELSELLDTTPNYLLGVVDKDDSFIAKAETLLLLIKDERAKEMLLAQIAAIANM